MSYGRQTISDGLRKAGQAIRNFDQSYSDKIMDMYVKADDPNPNQIKGMIGLFAGGAPVDLGYTPSAANKPMMDKARVTSAVSKYVLPAAGVTLAGQGLIDIAGAIGQQTQGTLEP